MATTSRAIPPVIDDPDAPQIFVTELTGGGVNQGNLNLTFSTLQYDHGKTPPIAYRKTTLRLIIPVGAIAGAGDFINSLIGGASPSADAPKPTIQ